MKVFVIGAHGRVGQKVVEKLTQAGHSMYAGVRNTDSIEQSDAAQVVPFDLHDDIKHMEEAFKDVEAVYFVAGSGGSDLLQTDLFGSVKAMQAAENKGIKRYIQLSSLFALDPSRWDEDYLADLMDFNIAKYFSDSWLMNNTELDYTIVQPGTLEEQDGTGKVTFGVDGPGSNSIEDVAQVLADALEKPHTYGQVILMHEGDTPIEEALDSL